MLDHDRWIEVRRSEAKVIDPIHCMPSVVIIRERNGKLKH